MECTMCSVIYNFKRLRYMKKILLGIVLLWSCTTFVAGQVVSFSFYGKDVQIRFDTSRRVRVKAGTGGEMVKCLEWLNDVTFETGEDCQRIRKELNLSDWAYVKLLEKLAATSLGKSNEAVLFMAWMMDLSEFNVGLCKTAGGLQLMYLTDAQLTDYHPMEAFGKKFYAYENPSLATFRGYERLSTTGNPVSFKKFGNQKFGVSPMDPITVTSKKNASFSFTFSFNQHMVDFWKSIPKHLYNNDPLQRWVAMAQTPLEEYLQNTLIKDMKRKVTGMSQQEAIQQMMWWVQTGFEDVDDNEKNVILSRLVRDVLGLKVAFICYPANTAIAVSITDADVRGAYVLNKGRHYVLCDASLAGATVGQERPGMAGQKKILTLLDQ